MAVRVIKEGCGAGSPYCPTPISRAPGRSPVELTNVVWKGMMPFLSAREVFKMRGVSRAMGVAVRSDLQKRGISKRVNIACNLKDFPKTQNEIYSTAYDWMKAYTPDARTLEQHLEELSYIFLYDKAWVYRSDILTFCLEKDSSPYAITARLIDALPLKVMLNIDDGEGYFRARPDQAVTLMALRPERFKYSSGLVSYLKESFEMCDFGDLKQDEALKIAQSVGCKVVA